MKPLISFLLAIMILLSGYNSPSLAQGQVMELDAYVGDFRLYLDGIYFPHKEVFLYDGELWVPMEDLAKALDLGYNFDLGKRELGLNSHDGLVTGASFSDPILYQRNYEIQALRRRIGEVEDEIREFQGRRPSTTPESKGQVKNIRVGFSDIHVFLDGEKLHLDRQPLIYNNDAYVSLASLAPLLYITPSLRGDRVDISTNSLLYNWIGYYDSIYMDKFGKLEELEKEKDLVMELGIPYEKVDSLRDMERYLNRHLAYIGDLPVAIDIWARSNNFYDIDISFRERHNSRWRNLSRRDVEAYIWDIYLALASLYDGEAKIQGTIKNPYYSSRLRRNYVVFDTVNGKIQSNFYYSQLDDINHRLDPIYIEELLNQELGSYYRVKFDYRARLSGYDLEVIIQPSSKRVRDWSPSMLANYLYDLGDLISYVYPDLNVYGGIVVAEDYTMDFHLVDGLVFSNSLNELIQEELNNFYDWFRYGNIGADISYSLVKRDEYYYQLIVDLDYDTDRQAWDQAALEELKEQVALASDYVSAMIDGDLFVEVYDKNQRLLHESATAGTDLPVANATRGMVLATRGRFLLSQIW